MSSRSPWNHNRHYRDLIARSVGESGTVLDLGCGDGWMARALALNARRVIGVDSDPEIIALARSLTPESMGIEFICGEMLEIAATEQFDSVVAVASLHHAGTRGAFETLRHSIRPGGRLVVLGLYRPASIADAMWTMAGSVAAGLLRLSRTSSDGSARIAVPTESLQDIRQAASEFLPGARMKRLLLFRYLLTWDRPPA